MDIGEAESMGWEICWCLRFPGDETPHCCLEPQPPDPWGQPWPLGHGQLSGGRGVRAPSLAPLTACHAASASFLFFLSQLFGTFAPPARKCPLLKLGRSTAYVIFPSSPRVDALLVYPLAPATSHIAVFRLPF